MSRSPGLFGRENTGRRWLSPTAQLVTHQLGQVTRAITAGLSAPAGAPPANVVKVITLDLSTLRTDMIFDNPGTIVWYQSSTNPSDVVTVRYTDTTNDPIPFRPGNAVGGRAFSRLLISNAIIAGATATIVVMTEVAGGQGVSLK